MALAMRVRKGQFCKNQIVTCMNASFETSILFLKAHLCRLAQAAEYMGSCLCRAALYISVLSSWTLVAAQWNQLNTQVWGWACLSLTAPPDVVLGKCRSRLLTRLNSYRSQCVNRSAPELHFKNTYFYIYIHIYLVFRMWNTAFKPSLFA